jgi:hypothetical protein
VTALDIICQVHSADHYDHLEPREADCSYNIGKKDQTSLSHLSYILHYSIKSTAELDNATAFEVLRAGACKGVRLLV